jgi:hypothetical protein
VVGPKNVYKKAAYTLPDITEADLPDIDIGEPAAPAKPAPKIEQIAEGETFTPRSEIYDPKSDYAVTRGFKTNFNAAGQANSHALALPGQMAMNDADLAKALLDEAAQGSDPRNPSLQVSGASKIEGVGDFFTWLGESLGGTAGSFAGAATYGGLPGGAIGAGVGAVGGSILPGPGTLAGGVAGAATGFTTGSAANFVLQGIDGMKQEMLQEPEVLKGLKDGTINPKQLLTTIMGAGTLIGAIDAVPAGKFLAQIGGKQVGKEVVRELLKKAAIKGAGKGFVEEGGTETLQGTISEVTKAVESGDWDVVNRGLSVLDQGLAGGVGGAGFGSAGAVREQQKLVAPVGELYKQAAAEKAAKGGEANEALPAGATAPDPAAAAAAGTTSPGNVGGAPPAQPAGAVPATAQPAVNTPVDGVDVTLKAATGALGGAAGAGPQAAPTSQPTIDTSIPEEEDDVEAPPPADAAAAELARLTREQVARQQQEDTARAQEKAAAAPAVSTGDIAQDVAAAVVAKQAANTSKKAPRARTPKVTAPVVDAPVVNNGVPGENLGTGVNLAETPPVTTPTPAAPPVPTPAAGESPAAQPLQGNEPTVSGTAAPAAAPDLASQVAALAPAETPATVDAPIPDWMAENNKNAVTLADALGVTDMIKGMAERGITAKAISTALRGKLDVDQVRAVRDHLGIAAAGPKDFVGAEVPSSAPAPRAEVIKAAEVKAEPVARAAEPVKVEKPLTRGELIKQRAAEARAAAPAAVAAKETSDKRGKLTIGRKEPVALTGSRRVVVAPKPTGGVVAERVGEVEVAERAPEAPSAPAAAPVAGKAKRNEVSDVVSDETITKVSQDLDERINELAKPLVHDTIRDATAAFENAMPKGRSVRERTAALRERMPEIIAEVKRRLEADLAEHERQFRTAEEKRQEADKEKASAEQAKREAQAKAETGQKKERAGAKKGLSPAGIKVQSDDSVLGQAEKQRSKKLKLQDKLVLQHAELIKERSNKDTTPERKAEIAELEKAVREQRVAAAEAKAEAGPGLSEEHQEIEADIQEATADIAIPEILPTDSTESQIAAAKDHIAAFLKATNHIEVAGRHDRVHNSPLENLVVYARKLRGKKAEVTGHGAGEFWKAHNFVNAGELEAFTNLVTDEKIKGSELREETTGRDDDVDVAEALEEGESVDRTYRQPEDAPTDLALRKGGRQAAVDRAQAEAARDDNLAPGGRGRVTTTDADGKVITIAAETATARQRLRQLGDDYDVPMAGFFAFFRNMHVRRLMQLVGDVPVHIISDWDMQRLTGSAGNYGLYRQHTDRDIARGVKPAVYIAESAVMDGRGARADARRHGQSLPREHPRLGRPGPPAAARRDQGPARQELDRPADAHCRRRLRPVRRGQRRERRPGVHRRGVLQPEVPGPAGVVQRVAPAAGRHHAGRRRPPAELVGRLHPRRLPRHRHGPRSARPDLHGACRRAAPEPDALVDLAEADRRDERQGAAARGR